ncbi:histidinol-phosphate transaminase [Reinekea marinisedimentorum]|uniref:Histidinol-phosphate aminotransferase n=1 Tax=Reinekea marinisedimentorum TaxID=230495 RepID=A0A4R3HZH6_9GAMM|nr:histidinol-phosphate transaminase [Reinekea marinisedimentorum]TCS38807.1 histidinol-phosphate aminotransferase [Reinekea marinisedimentorum]
MITERTNRAFSKVRPYIPGANIDQKKEEYGLESLIKLASNENPVGVSPKGIAALNNMANVVNIYPDPSAVSLREAIGRKLGVSKDEVIVSNGASGVLRLVTEILIEEGDEVVYSKPTFPAYYNNTVRNGGIPVEIPLTKDYAYNLAGMAEAITEKTKLIIICNPNNPTGTILTFAEIEKFLKQVPKDILIIVDEAYIEYVENRDQADSLKGLKQHNNLLIVRTFSKIYGLAGLRIGYGLACKQIIDTLYQAHQTFVTSSPALAAAEAALDDDEFLEEVNTVNKVGKKFLTQEFSAMGFDIIPSEANFLFVDMKAEASHIYEELLKKGCIIRPMGKFVRITIGTESENKILVSALKEIK